MCFKIFDETIVTKWKAEALSAPDIDITECMVNWCIAEIRYKSKQFTDIGSITAFDGDVVKSDAAISPSLRKALIAAAAPLENVPDVYYDWHPGSDYIVLDLVHPSLFPVVYGRTRILKDSLVGLEDCVQRCGEGETLKVPPSEEAQLGKYRSWGGLSGNILQDEFSRKFQWLPCEVRFEGNKVK
jgi:hypothetical protein